MAEAAFSEDGKYYSAITQDGRLKIWDTETNILKQEYTPDLHLTAPPTCLQWLNVKVTFNSKKGKRKSVSEDELQCIAIGTTSGKVLIYSVTQAKVETVLSIHKNNEQHSKKVQAVDWHRNYGLFSCSSDNIVYEWNLQNSNVRNKYNINVASNNKQSSKVSSIKLIPHNQKTDAKFLVAASWQVRLWRLDPSEATVVKCLGHNASPKAILNVVTLNEVCWLIEGSQNERLLSFWDVTITDEHLPQLNGEEETPSKRQRRKSISAPTIPTPTYNFVLEDAPRIIDAELKKEDGTTRLSLAACTRSGVLHYYGHILNGVSTKPIKPSVTIQVTTPDATPLPLQACRLPSSGDILLGYNSGPTLLFEKVSPDLKLKTQILIRGEATKSKKKVNQVNEVNKVRTDETSNDVTYVEPMGGVDSRKRATPGANVEVSMESRLANLALDVKGRGKSAVNQNLTKLLVQGLHSNDKNLILMVLQQNDPGVASRTVSALPADYVGPLLTQLAEMASRRTSQCSAASTWTRAVLQRHAALLLAATGTRTDDPLARLQAILTHRRSHLCQLLNLKGRLDLTLSQRTARDDQIEHEPVLHYNDSSSEEEMELEKYQSESDQSWEDGDDDQSDHDDHDEQGDHSEHDSESG